MDKAIEITARNPPILCKALIYVSPVPVITAWILLINTEQNYSYNVALDVCFLKFLFLALT